MPCQNFHLSLCCKKKQENPTIGMAKIQIKSERLTPFGGLFSIMEQFDSTGIIHNFYKAIIQRLDVKKFGLNATSRIKAFVFRFISVPAKWIRTSRRYVLNIYTCNNAYADVFQTDFGQCRQLMRMILCIASSHIVGQGDIVGRSGCFKFKLSANSVMRGRVNAIRTFKGLVADLRKIILQHRKILSMLNYNKKQKRLFPKIDA